MTKKRFYFKLITSVVVTALLCHDISWAGGVRQSKLSPGSIFASDGVGRRLRMEALDTFLMDPKTGTHIFRYNKLPRPPKELAKDLDGFFEVTGRAAIEGDIARITVKLDGKPAVLCFSKEPLTDSRRYWFESVSISRITGELKRFYNTHRSIPYGTGLDAREKGVFLPADIDDLVSIFTALDIPAGLRFIDLGSGDGRVTAMAGAYNLLATGIEYEKDLFRLGLDMKRRILSRYISKDRVRFINSNFMDEDLSQYDVMFYSAAGTYEVADLEEKIMRELRDDAVLALYGYGDSYKDWLSGWSRFKIDNTMVFARRDNNPLFMRLKENAKKTPGGRWPWLKDLLARYGLPDWLQVPIEQAFIGLGYVLYFTGSPILASFILPVFIGLHYLWKRGREVSIRDILVVSLMNLIGFALATAILTPIMFILSSVGHHLYNNWRDRGITNINLWEDERVVEIARDLEENGLRNFVSIDDIHIPEEIKTSSWYKGVYRHRNGLQIIKKLVEPTSFSAAVEFLAKKGLWCCPAFFAKGDDMYIYELNLIPLGYKPLGVFLDMDEGNLTEKLRNFIRYMVLSSFEGGDEWFIHGHLHESNLLVRFSKGIPIDIRIIDWKYLEKSDTNRYKELRDFLNGKRKSLVGADLKNAGLSGLNLDGADLSGADLTEADLSWVNLIGAVLEKAILHRAVLCGTDMRGSNMKGANLSGAVLKWTDIRNADLNGADLRYTDLSKAKIDNVDFGNTKMAGTKFDSHLGKKFKAEGYYVRYEDDYCIVTSPTLYNIRKEPPAKGPGGRWPWLRDLLARYGLPGWLQVSIEQAFIWLGYVLYFTGSPILASFILPVFIGLHYVWKKARAPSIRDILIVSLMNLIGFALATPILAPIMFILSSIAHYIYNTLVIRYAMPQEGRAVFKEGGGYSTLSGQTIKDLLIFEPGIGLFDFVNETITKWGKDRLRWLLTHPYLDEKEILARQEIVCCLMNNPAILMEIRRILAIFSQRQDINETVIMLRRLIESLPRDNIYSQYFRTVTEGFMQRPWDNTILYKVMGLIGELDAFSSLAQSGLRYASSEQGHITMPRILEQAEPLFQMKQGIIPGNLRRRQVPNDIELSSEKRFALITGPNISGKTILLRTIGRMAILSQIGSLVPAEDMAITPMRIHSLISINDDPQTGRSYTEVEADELSGILDSTDKGCKQIYLIDEMLRGMYRNARDTVEPDAVKILASSGALTVLTTHNSPLTELAEEDKNIANYHFTDTDNKEYRYRLMHGRSTINNAIKFIESLSWLRVLIPYKERWRKHFERHAETPSVVHVENENIKGKQINIFNKNAVLVWKGLIDSLKDKLNSLKEKIEKERGISGWDIMGFISFFIGSILGTIIEDPGKIKSKFFDALMLTLLFFIIAPLLIRLYLILEKILSIRPKKKLLEKILQKQEHNINAKPQMQQVLEGYLEKTAARSNDTDLYGRVLDTYAYSLGESTTRSLGVIGGERNLLAVIDNTRTVWGRERLRWLLTHPYHNTERIRNRQQIVKIFNEKKVIREELIRYLEEIRASWERNIVSQTPPGHFLKIHTNERRILLYVNDILEAAEGLKKILEELDIDGNTEIAELLKDLGLINYELAELKVGKGPISRLMFLLNFDDSRLRTIKDMLLGKDTNGLQYRLRYVLSAIGEVDAYLSLAELPDRFTHWATMPEIAKAGRGVPVLDIKDGYCPTIPIETSQPNTVLLNSENRILVIGGAHGAGKSTFLRTINQLEILGSIGSFVPARAMVFTPIEILSCMNLQDAPDRGLSYFGMVADFLNRLYGSSLSRDDYYIASIDEFLEGTNTTEAREIAEAVIKWLSENNIPAVIVSQDTEVLTIVAAKQIPNVSIAHPERVVVSGKRFAYKIVPGLPDEIAICRELLKRPLNRHLREAILKVMQGKAELEDLPAAGGIEIDADTKAGTSV